MNRYQFLDILYNNFLDFHYVKDGILHFNLDIITPNNKDQLEQQLLLNFSNILNECGLEKGKHLSFLQSISFKVTYDFYYEEEFPDSQLIRYNVLLNPHMMYDQLILESQNNLTTTTLYRIEKSDGNGLYSGKFASVDVDINKNPDPKDDELFCHIFKPDLTGFKSDYKNKWFFAFSSIHDAINWIDNNEIIDQMKKDGYTLKEITVPSDFVIKGNKQAVYQKQHIIYENNFDLEKIKKSSYKLTL